VADDLRRTRERPRGIQRERRELRGIFRPGIPAGWFLSDRQSVCGRRIHVKEWRTSSSAYRTSEVAFDNLHNPLVLSLYFSSESEAGDNGIDTATIGIIIVIAAIAALFLIWFLFFFRRSYNVTIVSSASITGKDRARRKRAYSFTVDGGASGTVSYKVGEEGQWKVLTPGPGGEYVIPGKEVVDNLMIEHR